MFSMFWILDPKRLNTFDFFLQCARKRTYTKNLPHVTEAPHLPLMLPVTSKSNGHTNTEDAVGMSRVLYLPLRPLWVKDPTVLRRTDCALGIAMHTPLVPNSLAIICTMAKDKKLKFSATKSVCSSSALH